MRLLLLGCTGFVGRELVPSLLEADHQLTLVSRRLARGYEAERADGRVKWLQLDPAKSVSWQTPELVEALSTSDAVVNLAGEPIAEKRWTAVHRKVLEDSRLDTTRLLVDALAASKSPPSVLINASAIGFFGTSPTCKICRIQSGRGRFPCLVMSTLGDGCCRRTRFRRQVSLRIGIVLASDGGALGKMLPIFRTGFGGPIGTGKQWMSWIHRSDLCALIQTALTDQAWSGVVNAVSPEPVSMAAFSKQLGRSLNRPSLLPVPGPILQLLLGDGAKVVLEGQQVTSERLDSLGFSFRYPTLVSALAAATS
jgi:uncharacterized protein (TIGR01777 family)